VSNRAFLLNTSLQSSDPHYIETQLSMPGNDFLELATAAYRVPIPWLCCFRREHLQPVEVQLYSDEKPPIDAPAMFSHARFPCCSVEEARRNLNEALPIFESIAGDKETGRAYWRNAVRHLKDTPLPFLTVNVVEVMYMSEPEAFQAQLESALVGDTSSIPHLRDLAGFEVGVRPYRPDVLYAVSGPNLDKGRISNATALDFQGSHVWHLSAGSTRPEGPAEAGYVDDEVNFVSIVDGMEKMLNAKVPSGSIFLGFMPVRPGDGEHLKVLISTETDDERRAVIRDRDLRTTLDGPTRGQIQDACRHHGFTFAGFVFRSTESVKRRFAGDWEIYNDWVMEPAEPALGMSSGESLWQRLKGWMGSR